MMRLGSSWREMTLGEGEAGASERERDLRCNLLVFGAQAFTLNRRHAINVKRLEKMKFVPSIAMFQ